MTKSIIELHYLPCIEFFATATTSDILYIEAHENYQKQSYRNRCKIQTANQTTSLSLPITFNNKKKHITSVQTQKETLRIHRKSIESAYSNSPYYEYFADPLWAIFNQNITGLFDFNLEILKCCLTLAEIKTKLKLTDCYLPEEEYTQQGIKDFRNKIHPKKPMLFKHPSYRQIFGKEFAPNLSIIDLLFCKGPETLSYINGLYQ